jgi:HD-GYP domain-containing protein (c-di-GMP phosphodiesterase class II)
VRVCYIALNLAHGVGLPDEQRAAVFYAALLHDAGVTQASSELCRTLGLSEDALFKARPDGSPQRLAMQIAPSNGPEVVEVFRSHVELGARIAKDLELDGETQAAISAHHERWDGQGYPQALKAEAIPPAARIVAAADIIETLIAEESNPLTARRNLVARVSECGGRSIDPTLAAYARDLVRSDTFWLGLHDEALPRGLMRTLSDARKEKQDALLTFATAFATIADAKGEHTAGHSQRTGEVARQIGQLIGLPPARLSLLFLAGLLHDIGLLGVPARVIAKPDILSLTEMETMRKHPSYSQMVLERVPGMAELAQWVGAHHERPDGKGYPELAPDAAIPLEARILALADTYVALTSARPYRQALSPADARKVLLGGAGTQLDANLVDAFCSAIAEPTSSRTARHPVRTR